MFEKRRVLKNRARVNVIVDALRNLAESIDLKAHPEMAEVKKGLFEAADKLENQPDTATKGIVVLDAFIMGHLSQVMEAVSLDRPNVALKNLEYLKLRVDSRGLEANKFKYDLAVSGSKYDRAAMKVLRKYTTKKLTSLSDADKITVKEMYTNKQLLEIITAKAKDEMVALQKEYEAIDLNPDATKDEVRVAKAQYTMAKDNYNHLLSKSLSQGLLQKMEKMNEQQIDHLIGYSSKQSKKIVETYKERKESFTSELNDVLSAIEGPSDAPKGAEGGQSGQEKTNDDLYELETSTNVEDIFENVGEYRRMAVKMGRNSEVCLNEIKALSERKKQLANEIKPLLRRYKEANNIGNNSFFFISV